MAVGINLLPGELKPKGYALKLSKKLKDIATLAAVIFAIVALLFVGANVVLSTQLRSSQSKEDSLKKEIKALEETEQKLVLLQDRLSKITEISEQNSGQEEAEILNTVISQGLENIDINGAKLDKGMAEIEIGTDVSSNLTGFFNRILKLNFKKIEITDFEYDKLKGYQVHVGISK